MRMLIRPRASSPTRMLVWALVLTCNATPRAMAQSGPDEQLGGWTLRGETTVRYDRYEITGDDDAAIFSSPGDHGYGLLSFALERRFSAYHSLRLDVRGLYNESDYRHPQTGAVPERLRLAMENGNRVLPYRLELGDTYAYFTQSTLQRNLKGLVLELQPGDGSSALQQSFLLIAGTNEPHWRDIHPRDGVVGAASWLVDWHDRFSTTVHYVRNEQTENVVDEIPEQTQDLAGLASELHLGDSLSLEFELARVWTERGEIPTIDDDDDAPQLAAGDESITADAMILELTSYSRSGPGFRLRLESLDDDYRPIGSGTVVNGRRSAEGHLSLPLAAGTELRGRVQYFRNGWDSDNPHDTRTVGFSARGPLLGAHWPSLFADLDGFIRDRGDRDRTTDQLTAAINATASVEVGEHWSPRLGVYFEETQSDVAETGQRRLTELQFGSTLRFGSDRLRATLSPAIAARQLRTVDGIDRDLQPSLQLFLASRRHTFSVAAGLLRQRPEVASGSDADVDTISYAASYRFSGRRLGFGFDSELYARRPSASDDTTSSRVGVFISHSFASRPIARVRSPKREIAARAELDLLDLRPNSSLSEARSRLSRTGLRQPRSRGQLLIYAATIDRQIYERQWLVLEGSDDAIVRSALLFAPYVGDDPSRLEARYDRIQQLLIARYGQPTEVVRTGDAGATTLDDIRRGALIRITEWATPSGTLRLGIPYVPGAELRIELQLARSFPPVADTAWSIDRGNLVATAW